MKEFPTNIAPTQEAPKITPEEVEDLSNLWQEIGGGEGVNFSEDPEYIREQMWRSQEKGFREIMADMHFEQDSETEQALKAETNPDSRARLEERLINNYWEQVQLKAPSNPGQGSGTTPRLIKEMGDADCQARATMVSLALQDAGLKMWRMNVAGHAIALAKDSKNAYWQIDATSTYRPVKLTTEPKSEGELMFFDLNSRDRGKMQAYYSKMIAGPVRDMAVSGALGNLNVMHNAVKRNRQGAPQRPGRHISSYIEFGEKHAQALLTQNWDKIASKLYGDHETLHKYISQDEDFAPERVKLLAARYESLPADLSIQQKTELNTRVLLEFQTARDQVIGFLQNKNDIPTSLSPDVAVYLQTLHGKIKTEDEETQKLFIEEMSLFIEHAE